MRAAYHDQHVRNLRPRRVQCDGIWNFCYAKAKNAPEDKIALGAGDVWTWVAINADMRLGISYLVGKRHAQNASRLMHDLAGRTVNRFQLTTDGHHVYLNAVEAAFGADIDYAMLVKVYGRFHARSLDSLVKARVFGMTQLKEQFQRKAFPDGGRV